MKILFCSMVYPDAASPARGTFNYELCQALATEHDVRVIAPRAWTEDLTTWTRGGRRQAVDADDDATVPVRYPWVYYVPKFWNEHLGRMMWWSVRREITAMRRTWRPNCVLSYWVHPDGELGLRAAEMFDIPHGVIVGGSDVLLLPNDPKRGRSVRRVLHGSDCIFTVSDALKQTVENLGIAPHKVHTVRQGINPDRFFPGDQHASRTRLGLPVDRPLLLWVGRMVAVKGLGTLIDAARQLQQSGQSFQLCLVGDGPERAQREQEVQHLGLSDCVRFVGAVSHDELPDWYRAAAATVLSSLSEGLPNVLRESLACGVPFVSTDVGSVREIADRSYSEIVPTGDATGFAHALRAVLNGTHRQSAQHYKPRHWSDTAAEMIDCFAIDPARSIDDPLRNDESETRMAIS